MEICQYAAAGISSDFIFFCFRRLINTRDFKLKNVSQITIVNKSIRFFVSPIFKITFFGTYDLISLSTYYLNFWICFEQLREKIIHKYRHQ